MLNEPYTVRPCLSQSLDARIFGASSKLLVCSFQAGCGSGLGSSGKARFPEHTVLIPLGMMRQASKPKSQSAEQAIFQKVPNRMS
jgi:hypothetical protein